MKRRSSCQRASFAPPTASECCAMGGRARNKQAAVDAATATGESSHVCTSECKAFAEASLSHRAAEFSPTAQAGESFSESAPPPRAACRRTDAAAETNGRADRIQGAVEREATPLASLIASRPEPPKSSTRPSRRVYFSLPCFCAATATATATELRLSRPLAGSSTGREFALTSERVKSRRRRHRRRVQS